MLPHIWNRWFRKNSQTQTIENQQTKKPNQKLGLENLEDRTVPATVDYQLGAFLDYSPPVTPPVLGYGFQRNDLTITLDPGETLTMGSVLDTSQTYLGNSTPNASVAITDANGNISGPIITANSAANFQLYRLGLSTTSAGGIRASGVIGQWDDNGSGNAGFGWAGLNTQQASGYLRSRKMNPSGTTFDNQAAPMNHYGYLYINNIIVNDPSGTGTVIFNGFTLTTGTSGGFTQVSTSTALTGGGPWGPIGAMAFQVNTGSAISQTGPVSLGGGVFPGGVSFNTGTFDNTFGGGQKLDVTSNFGSIASNVINIGTSGEKIYSTKGFSLSSRSQVMDIDNPTGTSTYNLTSNELLAIQASGGLNLSSGNAVMNWGSSTSTNINLLSANFGGSLSITSSGNVVFNNTVQFPNSMTFTINPSANSDVLSTNPNDIDFIIEGGKLVLGPFDKNSSSSQQLRNFGTAIKPISVSVPTLGDTELLGSLYLYNKANPVVGGQSGNLSVTGPVIMNKALNINVGPNTLNINTNVFRTTDIATITSNVLNINGTELRGDAGVEIQQFDPNMDFYAGKASAVNGAFNLSQSDITTKIVSGQYLQIGQAGMLGNFYVFSGDVAGGLLDLATKNFSLKFLGKTSSILLNAGLKLADNRRYSINIGTGDVVGQTYVTLNKDFNVGGTNGAIDFTSARGAGTIADPLDITVARLDRSTLTGNMNLNVTQPAATSNFDILGQVNAGLNDVRIRTMTANSNLRRTNANTEADIVGGTIEFLAGTGIANTIGTGASPIRIKGNSVTGTVGGDIYLAAVTANGQNGSAIDIANSGVLNISGGLTSGDAGKVALSGSTVANASKSTFRLAASELINRTSTVRGSLDIGANTTLDLGRFSETLGILTGTGFITSDAIQGQAGKLTIDNGIGESCVYAGIISGDVQVVKTSSTVAAPQGAGTLNLGGANTYTGGTVVQSGTLILSNNTAIGTGKITLGRSVGAASSVFMSMSNNITVNNPVEIANQLVTIKNETGSNTITSPITFGFNTTIDVLSPGSIPTTLTLSGALSGNQQIFKTSTGNLILSADNNISGGIQVQAGYLEVQANKALGTGLTDFFTGANFGIKDQNPADPTPLLVEIPGGLKFRGTSTATAMTSATLVGNGGQIVLSGNSATPLTISVANSTDTLSLLGGTSTVLIEDNNNNVNIVKAGAGTLKLTGVNNFNNLTAANGTVIGVSDQAFGRNLVTVTGSVVNAQQVYGTVAFDPGLGNTINLPNSFSILGPGDSQRTAALEGLTGTTNIVGNVAINPNAGVTTVALAVFGGAIVDLKGAMSDGGNNLTLQKKGTGRLIFEQANNFGGGTQLNAGEIEVKAQGALGNGTVITNQDTSLIFNLPTGATSTFANPLLITGAGLDKTSGVIQVTSGTIKITTGEIKLLGNSTISVNPVNASLTLDGKITDQAIANGQPGGPNTGGPYSLTKKGTGKLTLNGGGLTTYRGGTAIQDGVVEVIAQNAMGTGLVNISNGAALQISGTNIVLPNNFLLAGKGGSGNPGVIQVTSGGTIATINGGIGLNSDVGFGVVAGSSLVLTNQIDEASGQPGPYGVEKTGAGVLRLEGTVANLYDGQTDIKDGEVQIAKNSALGTGTVAISAGATLATDSSINLANKISVVGDGYTGEGAIFSRSGQSTFSGAVTLKGNTRLNATIDTSINLSGTISESVASNINKDGLGTIRVSGTGNGYTGPTSINAGILEAASNEALGKSDITIADKSSLSTIGSITLSNAKISAEGVGALVGLKTIGAIRSESGSSKVTGNITMTNGTTVSAGNGATLDLQGVIGDASASKTLSKGDLGTVILSGSSANTYTGGTLVDQGTLVVKKNGALGDTTINAPATIADKATLAIDAGAGALTVGNPLRLQGVGADGNGALQAISGTGILNTQAVITLDGTAALGASKGATLKLGGVIADDADPAQRSITKVGEGTVRLETTNSYEGTTTVQGGVLVAAASDAFGSLNKLVTVNGGTTLAVESSNPVSLTNPIVMGGAGTSAEGAALRIGSAGTPTTASLTGTVGLTSNTVIKVEDKSTGTLTNTISKDGSAKTTVYLQKTGLGTLTLSAANTYDGGTRVTEGKLVANNDNALSNQPINVATGATLGLGDVAIANVINLAVDAKIASEENKSASLINPGNVNAAGNFAIENATGSKLSLKSFITDGSASGKLTKTGSGELLFQNTTANQIDSGVDVFGGQFTLDSAKATFGGNLLVSGATIPASTQLLQGNQIDDKSKVTLATGTLNLNGNSDTVAGVTMGGASEIQGTGTLTSTTDYLFSQGKAFANLAGSVGLIKDTSALVLLAGNNSFSGHVSLNDGTLELQGGQAVNDSSNVIFGSNTTELLVDASETLGNLSSTFAGSKVSLPNVGTTLTTGTATNSTYAGQLVDQGDGTLLKIGTGELTLTGINKLSTLIDISQGTLNIGSSDALGVQNTGPLVIVEAPGALKFSLPGTSTFDNPIDLYGTLKGATGTSKLTGNITLFNQTNSIDVASGATVIISSAAPDNTVASVTLNKTGTGVLGFNGPITLSNTSTGQLNVQAGTVIVSADNAVDGGVAPIVVSSGATLYADATGIVAGLKLDNPLTINGTGVTGAGAFAAKGGKTILNSASPLTVNTDSTIYVETGSTLEINQPLVGSGKINITGGGKVVLKGSAAGYTGDITITNGELVVQDPNALGTGTVTVGASGKLTLDGNMTLPNNFILSGGLNGTAGSQVIFTGKITLKGTGNFSIGAGGQLDFQGEIKELGGSFGITSSGDGNVKLSGANTFTGTATVSGPGKLIINNTSAISATNPVVVSAGTFEIDVDTTLGSITGPGTIDLTSKTLTLGALNTTNTLSGDIIGSGNLVKVGTGDLTLSGTVANSYSGTTTIKAGTLNLAKTAGVDAIAGSSLEVQAGATISLTNSDQINDATDLIVNGGTFKLNAKNDSVGTATLKASGTISGTGTLTTVTGPFDLQSGTITGNIGGTLGITKSNPGTVTLGGINTTLSGPVNVNDGVLNLTTATALNANTQVFVDTTGTINLNASNTFGSLDGTGTVDLAGNTLTTGAFGDANFTGTLKGTNASKVIKTGTSTWDIGAVGTNFLGTVDVNAGKMRVNGTTTLSAANAVSVLAAATFEISVDETIGSITGAGIVELNGKALTTGSLGATTFSGNITGGANSKLIKVGASTFTLSGTTANTVANADVQAGTLLLNKTAGVDALGSGTTTIQSGATLSLSAANQINNGGTVSVKGGTFATNSNNETINLFQLVSGLASGGGVITSTQAFDLQAGTVNAILAGTNGLTKSTVGVVSLNFANPNLAGTATISGGDLILALTGSLNANTPVTFTGTGNLIANATMVLGALTSTGGNGTVQMGSNALTITSATDTSFSGVISGSSTLTKEGTGAQTLTGINTYAGPTTVNAGKLILASTATGTTIKAPVTVNNGGSLRVDTSTAVDATFPITVNLGGLFEIKADATIGSIVGAGNAQLNSSTLTTGSLGSTEFSGKIDGTLAGKLVKVGSTTFTLSGTQENTFGNAEVQGGTLVLNKTTGVNAIGGGVTSILTGATLSLSVSNQISDSGTVSVKGGTFATNGNNETVSTFQLVSGQASGAGIVTSTQAFDLQSGLMNVILAGSNGLTKSTSGVVNLNLSSPNIAGVVTISGGELILNALTAIGSDNPINFTAAGTLTSNTVLKAGLLTSAGLVGTIAMGANDLTIKAASSGTFGGSITGTGQVTKDGTGTQIFNGSNTYTGLTFVTAGILALAGASNNTVIVGNVSIDNGGTLRLDASEQIANDRTITLGTGTLALAGAGSATTETIKRLILVRGNVTGGVTSVLNVTELVDVAISNTAIDATITGSASFNLIGDVNYTVLKPFQVTGPINVFKGTMTLSSPISPSILTPLTITGPGKVVATLNNQISDTQTVTIASDGIYDIAGTSDTVGGVTLTKGSITGTTGVLSSATSFAVQSGLISAILGGSSGLVKSDASGTVKLTRNNLFTGSVQVQGGTLELAATGNALVSSNVTVNGGTLLVGTGASGSQLPNSSTVTVSAGLLNLGSIDQTLAIINMTGGEITGSTGRLFTSQSNFNFANGRVSAILAGASTGLTQTGTGTVTLANTNQYGGLTTIAGGNLIADANSNAIPGNVTISGGTLRLNRSSQIVDSATLNMTGGTVSFANGQVTETVGTLIMDNGLIGPNAGTPLGTLNAGAFDLRAGRVNATLGGSGKLTKSTGGTLTLSGTNTFNGGNEINGGVVNLSAIQGGSLPGTTLINAATVNQQAANQVPGNITINTNGTLNLASFANSAQSLTISGGTITGTSGVFSATTASGVSITSGNIDAILGGGFGLTKSGFGAATLNKPAAYNGATSITGGILQLTNTGGIPDGSVVTISSGAKLDLNGLTDQFNGLQGQGSVSLGSNGINSLILGVTNPTATNNFQGVIDGNGTLVKSGSGAQTLSGPNTFTGPVQVQGGTLEIAGPGSTSVLPDNSAVTVFAGANLAVNKNETIGALTGSGVANLGANTTLISNYTTDTEVQTGLLGSGTLQKNGASSINLSSSNPNFSGKVILAQGGLRITGVLGGITSVLGGNLTGTGQATNVQLTAGTYSPGSSPGIFNVGTLTSSGTATYLQEINGTVAGSGFDQTIISQGVNVSGMKLTTTFGSGFKPVAGQSFTMVDNQSSNPVTGTFSGLPEGKIFTVGTTRVQITYKGGNGNDIVLSIPQASSTFGLVMGSPGNLGSGLSSTVTVYNTAGTIASSFVPFPGFGGQLRTAVGDVTGDGIADIAVVTGVGAVPAVKVFNGANNSLVYSFFAFGQGFKGGLSVAIGDTNSDGFGDIIVGTLTASNNIVVFSGANLTMLKSFFPFGSGFTGGVNLAAGDVTGDGKAEIIAGAASGSSRVVVLDVSTPGSGSFTQLQSFFAFSNQNIPGGVLVSAADFNGDGIADILAGTGSGVTTPQMRVFNGPNATPGLTVNLNANYLNGVRVTIGDLNGDGLLELVAGAGPGYQPVISAFASANGAFVRSFLPYPNTFRGGILF